MFWLAEIEACFQGRWPGLVAMVSFMLGGFLVRGSPSCRCQVWVSPVLSVSRSGWRESVHVQALHYLCTCQLVINFVDSCSLKIYDRYSIIGICEVFLYYSVSCSSSLHCRLYHRDTCSVQDCVPPKYLSTVSTEIVDIALKKSALRGTYMTESRN